MSLLAYATVLLAGFTAWMAEKTSDLAKTNKNLIEQGEKQHRERLMPMCVPLTSSQLTISSFNEVLAPKKNIPGMIPGVVISDDAAVVWIIITNKGLGPALNIRFHFNGIDNTRITKDFLVSHILPPGDSSNFLSEIPREEFKDAMGVKAMGIEPHDVVQRAYFLVCEYESIFSGENFHSIVSKGYLDPSLANDGKNKSRLQRPRTPPVVFKDGLDPATPLWPVPSDDEQFPGEFLNHANPNSGN
jgi:hypothetical protein